MPSRLISVVFDAADPARLARFWARALGWSVTVGGAEEIAVGVRHALAWADGGTPRLLFVPGGVAKVTKNRTHLDLVSETARRQRDTVERLLGLGARPVDIGQGDVPWVVLADPEGNELCVLEPRDAYRGTRDVAAVVVDCVDPRRLAGFWSQVTGWPVTGSSAEVVSLGPPGVAATRLELLAAPVPEHTSSRLHLAVAPARGDLAEAVARLEAAGGRRTDTGRADVTPVVLSDPEGNEFRVLGPRSAGS